MTFTEFQQMMHYANMARTLNANAWDPFFRMVEKHIHEFSGYEYHGFLNSIILLPKTLRDQKEYYRPLVEPMRKANRESMDEFCIERLDHLLRELEVIYYNE